MTARARFYALLLPFGLLACSEQPLLPVEGPAPEAGQAIATASEPAELPDPGAALPEGTSQAFSRAELAVAGLDDALERVLPVFADAGVGTELRKPLLELVESFRQGDRLIAQQAVGSAEAALAAYAAAALDAPDQAPDLEVLRLAVHQARAALGHLGGSSTHRGSEAPLPLPSLFESEDRP